jgi:GT2 family glycosyltransferase
MARPELTIVIPTYNRPDLLGVCLRSVRQHAPRETEVLVVDDGSPGAQGLAVAREFGLQGLRFDRRRGFCAAANLGISAANAPVVEILNDDTEVTPDWAAAALAVFRDSSVGAVAPLALMFSTSKRAERIDSAGDRFFIGGVAAKRGHDEPARPPYLERCRVFGASASCAFYRREALEAAGLFPERFGAYFEDVDLAFRLHRAGYQIVFEPASRVYHRVSSSYRKCDRRVLEQQSLNEERIFWRNLPSPVLLRAIPRHFVVLAGKLWRRYAEGNLAPFISGRLQMVAEIPEVMKHRRELQKRYPVLDVASWHMESRYWGEWSS